MSDGGEQAAGDAEGQTAPEEKSSARVCAETSLDALAVVGRGIMTTGSALLTAVQYTAYPIKEGAICVMDTTSEYFSPYLKQAANHVTQAHVRDAKGQLPVQACWL
ncbi:hypothetical protein AK812_SmicGene30596 [Symbiodinium microadriaticum]|uniref:Uncharacterized protein n=1 Tax=Symbiodinium microadriaticum TaxID=2951 RepID=A0A1Q9CYW0_SYMMI|nr:hypothetical protein AK812_SmicGene30596 [Symbiodinium microadriaticum]